MRPLVLSFFFLLLFSTGVLATSIGNVPPLEQRDLVVRPGLHRDYRFYVGGAERIDVNMGVPPELAEYITITDSSPGGAPREIGVTIDFPQDVAVPPGVHTVYFSANEIAQSNAQISTSVGVSFGFIIRSYTQEPLLEIRDVELPPVPNGSKANFTAIVVSRTLVSIPSVSMQVHILDENGSILATGRGLGGPLASGEEARITGIIDTQELPGGMYRSSAIAKYGEKTATYNKSLLRVGTLTIDLEDYTKTLTFNQTNKFQFRLRSNWNKELTRVSATVDLLGQTKRSPEQSIKPFAVTDTAEVYFDRTELPPGPYEGTLTVRYQELSPDPRLQDSLQTHVFTIPLHADVVLPPEPAKVEREWKITTTQVIIGVIILLLLINIVVAFLLLRPKRERPQQTPQAQQSAAAQAPQPPAQQPPQTK